MRNAPEEYSPAEREMDMNMYAVKCDHLSGLVLLLLSIAAALLTGCSSGGELVPQRPGPVDAQVEPSLAATEES